MLLRLPGGGGGGLPLLPLLAATALCSGGVSCARYYHSMPAGLAPPGAAMFSIFQEACVAPGCSNNIF